MYFGGIRPSTCAPRGRNVKNVASKACRGGSTLTSNLTPRCGSSIRRCCLIVYELITNAARHACSGGKREIRVELLRGGSYVICQVQDNGAPPRSVVPGRGLKIVHELVTTLNGNLKHKFGSHGTIFALGLSVQRWSAITTITSECKRIQGGIFGSACQRETSFHKFMLRDCQTLEPTEHNE